MTGFYMAMKRKKTRANSKQSMQGSAFLSTVSHHLPPALICCVLILRSRHGARRLRHSWTHWPPSRTWEEFRPFIFLNGSVDFHWRRIIRRLHRYKATLEACSRMARTIL